MKPILFNTEMVRAILEGRKTVTRRPVKPQSAGELRRMGADSCYPGYFAANGEDRVYRPPYMVGDVLYVRETWQAVYETEWSEEHPFTGENIRKLISNFDSIPKVEAGVSSECKRDPMKPRMKYFVFKASDIQYADSENGLIWRPSIHMPRDAARIFLRVTNVQVERLQEITAEGALDEGTNVEFPDPKPPYISLAYTEMRLKPAIRQSFANLWDSTTRPADRATYGWEANPWVWVIEFERIKKEETNHDK